MLVNCCVCNKDFERRDAEVKRNAKLGRNIYCSRVCAGKHLIGNIPIESKKWDHLKHGSSKDEYSPFRWYIRNCKRQAKKIDITVEDLKIQWDDQKGICPYTGWKLANSLSKTPDRASLDKIDSSKGYIKGNIQFISLVVQLVKNSWDSDVLISFAEAVANHKN